MRLTVELRLILLSTLKKQKNNCRHFLEVTQQKSRHWSVTSKKRSTFLCETIVTHTHTHTQDINNYVQMCQKIPLNNYNVYINNIYIDEIG